MSEPWEDYQPPTQPVDKAAASRMPQSEEESEPWDDYAPAVAASAPEESEPWDDYQQEQPKEFAPAIPINNNEPTRVSHELDVMTKDGDLSAMDTLSNTGDAIKEWWNQDNSWLHNAGYFLSIPQQTIMRQAVNVLQNADSMTTEEAKNILAQDEVLPSDIINFYWKDPQSTAAKIGRWSAGFAADVILDPLNMLAMPLSAGAKVAKVGEKVFKNLQRVNSAERKYLKGLEKIDLVLREDGTIEKFAPELEKLATRELGFDAFLKDQPVQVQKTMMDAMQSMTGKGVADELRAGERTLGIRIPFTNMSKEYTIPILGETLGKGMGATLGGAAHVLGLGKSLVKMVPGGEALFKLTEGFSTRTGADVFDDQLFIKAGGEEGMKKMLEAFESTKREELFKIKADLGDDEFKVFMTHLMDEIEMRPLSIEEAMNRNVSKRLLKPLTNPTKEDLVRMKYLEKHPQANQLVTEIHDMNAGMVREMKRRGMPFDELVYKKKGDARRYIKGMITNEWFKHNMELEKANAGITNSLDYLHSLGGNVSKSEKGRKYRGTKTQANIITMKDKGIKIFVDDPLELHSRRMQEMAAQIANWDLMEAAAKHSVKNVPTSGEWVKFDAEHFKTLILKQTVNTEDEIRLSKHADEVNRSNRKASKVVAEEVPVPDAPKEKLKLELIEGGGSPRPELSDETYDLIYNDGDIDLFFHNADDATKAKVKKEIEAYNRWQDSIGKGPAHTLRDVSKDAVGATDGKIGFDLKPESTTDVKFPKDPRDIMPENVDYGDLDRWKQFVPNIFKFGDTYVPAQVYDRLLYSINGHNLNSKSVQLAQALDVPLSIFRKNALWGPAYWGMNAMGNAMQFGINTGLGGINSFGKAVALMAGAAGNTKIRNIDGTTKIISNETLLQWAIEDGAFNSGLQGTFQFGPLAEHIASNREAYKENKYWKQMKSIGDVAMGWRLGKWIAEKSDQAPKLATYIDRLEKGFSRRAAAELADRHFYTFNVGGRQQDLTARLVPFSRFPIKTLEYIGNGVKNLNFAPLQIPHKVLNVFKGEYVEDPEVRQAIERSFPSYVRNKMPILGDLIPGGRHMLYEVPWAQQTMNMLFDPDLSVNPIFGMAAAAFNVYKADEDYSDMAADDAKKQAMRIGKTFLPIWLTEALNIYDIRTNGLGGVFAAEFQQNMPTPEQMRSVDYQFPTKSNAQAWRYKEAVKFGEHNIGNFLYNLYFGNETDMRELGDRDRIATKGEFIRKRFRQFAMGTASIQKMDANFLANASAMNRRIKAMSEQMSDTIRRNEALMADDILDNPKYQEELSKNYPQVKELLRVRNERDALMNMYNWLLRTKAENPGDDIIGSIFGVDTKSMDLADSPMLYDKLSLRAQEISDEMGDSAIRKLRNPPAAGDTIENVTVGAGEDLDDAETEEFEDEPEIEDVVPEDVDISDVPIEE